MDLDLMDVDMRGPPDLVTDLMDIDIHPPLPEAVKEPIKVRVIKPILYTHKSLYMSDSNCV
jgi:hypothetical protein